MAIVTTKGLESKKCCFCGDFLEGHLEAIISPDHPNRYICGTCVRYGALLMKIYYGNLRRSEELETLASWENEGGALQNTTF
jgi:hypothetical protein